jgi:hypothetical protein
VSFFRHFLLEFISVFLQTFLARIYQCFSSDISCLHLSVSFFRHFLLAFISVFLPTISLSKSYQCKSAKGDTPRLSVLHLFLNFLQGKTVSCACDFKWARRLSRRRQINDCRALVELCWQEQTAGLGENSDRCHFVHCEPTRIALWQIILSSTLRSQWLTTWPIVNPSTYFAVNRPRTIDRVTCVI